MFIRLDLLFFAYSQIFNQSNNRTTKPYNSKKNNSIICFCSFLLIISCLKAHLHKSDEISFEEYSLYELMLL